MTAAQQLVAQLNKVADTSIDDVTGSDMTRLMTLAKKISEPMVEGTIPEIPDETLLALSPSLRAQALLLLVQTQALSWHENQ